MDKFSPIKELGTGLERWKDEKPEKERQKMITNPKKIRKSGKTRSKKEKKRKKLEREISF